jgi:uncharacterized protein (TIGR00251 family)
VIIVVRVTPRSSRDAIEGAAIDGTLRLRVTAPPVDGAANRSVIKLLAGALSVPKSSITIVSGATGRNKRIHIADLEGARIRERWPGVSLKG